MSHTMDYPSKYPYYFGTIIPKSYMILILYKILGTRYQSLDRGGLVDPHHEREFIPIREPRDRSRDRSLDRGLYLEDDLYGRSRQSPNPMGGEFVILDLCFK